MEEYQSKSVEEFSIEVGYLMIQYINIPQEGMKASQKKEIQQKIEWLMRIYTESLRKGGKIESSPMLGEWSYEKSLNNEVKVREDQMIDRNVIKAVINEEGIFPPARQEIDVKSSRAVGRESVIVNSYRGEENGLANAPSIQPRQYNW
jgi:hypothetical protein